MQCQLTMNTKIATTESMTKAYCSGGCPDLPSKSTQKCLLVVGSQFAVKLPQWLMLLLPRVKIYYLRQNPLFNVQLTLLGRGYTVSPVPWFL